MAIAREAAKVFEGLFSASTYVDLRRLPELFCGFPRQRGAGPTFYPVACSPQAWAAAAPLSLIQSCLGLTFDPAGPGSSFTRACRCRRSSTRSCSRGLTVAGTVADIALRRSDRRVVVDVLNRRGPVSVVTTS